MTNEQITAAGFPRSRHFPTGPRRPFVPVYKRFPGVSGDLRFTGKVLADIFLGKITKWKRCGHQGQITPGGQTCRAKDITVVHRKRRLGHELYLV